MWIIVDKTGGIEASSVSLKPGLNIIGCVDGYVEPLHLELRSFTKNECQEQHLDPPNIQGEAIFVLMDSDSSLSWCCSDFIGVKDLLYAHLPGGRLIFGDDLFEVGAKLKTLTVDERSISYFISHGYLPPGQTFFLELKRALVGNKLIYQDGNFIEVPIDKEVELNVEINYNTFKKALTSVFEAFNISDDDGILISGGVDSGLITAIASHVFSKKPLSFTMQYTLPLDINQVDVERASKIADFYGLAHMVIPVNFSANVLNCLEQCVFHMPLAAHLSIAFAQIAQEGAFRGVKRVWCGQNADNAYNLGPTNRFGLNKAGFGDMLKRFYLSRQYISTLFGLEERSGILQRCAWRIVGFCGMLPFKYIKGYSGQPRNFSQLATAFLNAEDYTVLLRDRDKAQEILRITSIASPKKAREILFDLKLNSYLIGRDSRVVYVASKINGMRAVLPYSAVNMLNYFRHLELSLKDVFLPKRFINYYLKELIGNKAYRFLYLRREPKDSKALSFRDWQTILLTHTEFGQALAEEIQDVEAKWNEKIDPSNLQQELSLYWLKKVVGKLSDLGITIKSS